LKQEIFWTIKGNSFTWVVLFWVPGTVFPTKKPLPDSLTLSSGFAKLKNYGTVVNTHRVGFGGHWCCGPVCAVDGGLVRPPARGYPN